MSMASGKAPGTDKIPIRVIKDCLPGILPPSTSIINVTFESDIFPISWKIAESEQGIMKSETTTDQFQCSKFCQKFVSV